jgi:hypothetical protein
MPAAGDNESGEAALVLQLTVPAAGGLRVIASELATRVAEHLGAGAPDARSIGERVETLVSQLGDAARGKEDITFEFRRAGAELVIHARCAGVASEVRHPLPA